LLVSGPLQISEAFTTPTLFPTEKTLFFYGAARALAYLHRIGIIHRNVKPQNFFLDASLRPHLGSFECCADTRSGSKETCGTFRYMAPEIMNGQPQTAAIDVYAFGIMVYEVLEERRHEFLPGIRNPRDMRVEINKGYRPKPTKASPALVSLMTRCWAQAPETRPTFADLVVGLEHEGYWVPGTDPQAFATYKSQLDQGEATLSPDVDVIAKIARIPELYEVLKRAGPTAPFKELILQAIGWLTSTDRGINEAVVSFLRFELEDEVQLSAPSNEQ
jgi:serine/threonine protein kinase